MRVVPFAETAGTGRKQLFDTGHLSYVETGTLLADTGAWVSPTAPRPLTGLGLLLLDKGTGIRLANTTGILGPLTEVMAYPYPLDRAHVPGHV